MKTFGFTILILLLKLTGMNYLFSHYFSTENFYIEQK